MNKEEDSEIPHSLLQLLDTEPAVFSHMIIETRKFL